MGVKEILSRTVIMSADTKAVLDQFGNDITHIKDAVEKLDKKLSEHMGDEMHDFKTVKAHIAEVVDILRELKL
jgi:hypothetical protein